jgi:hypothetical protein
MLNKFLCALVCSMFVLAATGMARAVTVAFDLTGNGDSSRCGANPHCAITLTDGGGGNGKVGETLVSSYYFTQSGAGDLLGFDANNAVTNIFPSSGITAGPARLLFTVHAVTPNDITANSKGYYFASDVAQLSGAGMKAPATENAATSSPRAPVISGSEPPSLMLLGTGLALLAGGLKLRQSLFANRHLEAEHKSLAS